MSDSNREWPSEQRQSIVQLEDQLAEARAENERLKLALYSVISNAEEGSPAYTALRVKYELELATAMIAARAAGGKG